MILEKKYVKLYMKKICREWSLQRVAPGKPKPIGCTVSLRPVFTISNQLYELWGYVRLHVVQAMEVDFAGEGKGTSLL